MVIEAWIIDKMVAYRLLLHKLKKITRITYENEHEKIKCNAKIRILEEVLVEINNEK